MSGLREAVISRLQRYQERSEFNRFLSNLNPLELPTSPISPAARAYVQHLVAFDELIKATRHHPEEVYTGVYQNFSGTLYEYKLHFDLPPRHVYGVTLREPIATTHTDHTLRHLTELLGRALNIGPSGIFEAAKDQMMKNNRRFAHVELSSTWAFQIALRPKASEPGVTDVFPRFIPKERLQYAKNWRRAHQTSLFQEIHPVNLEAVLENAATLRHTTTHALVRRDDSLDVGTFEELIPFLPEHGWFPLKDEEILRYLNTQRLPIGYFFTHESSGFDDPFLGISETMQLRGPDEIHFFAVASQHLAEKFRAESESRLYQEMKRIALDQARAIRSAQVDVSPRQLVDDALRALGYELTGIEYRNSIDLLSHLGLKSLRDAFLQTDMLVQADVFHDLYDIANAHDSIIQNPGIRASEMRVVLPVTSTGE